MDSADKAYVVAIVVASHAPFIAAPELASNEMYVVGAVILGGIAVIGNVAKALLNRG